MLSTARTARAEETHETMTNQNVSPPDVGERLEAQNIPPRIRHQTIFQKYHDLGAGQSFTLMNDHDPKPLYYQFNAEHAGAFEWEYLESGPDMWRVRIGKPA